MINEVYHSIQGESTWAGRPCVFVRLTGCHLRCRYCDSEYTFHEGRRREVGGVVAEALGFGCDLVEVTGGEPLLQPNVHALMTQLCDAGLTVLIETSGACDISGCDPRVIRILDLKTPGSGEAERNLWRNLDHLTPRDEVKFVICDRSDYLWARAVIQKHRLHDRVGAVLISPVVALAGSLKEDRQIPGVETLNLQDAARWILEDRLPARLHVQQHKIIWDPAVRGV